MKSKILISFAFILFLAFNIVSIENESISYNDLLKSVELKRKEFSDRYFHTMDSLEQKLILKDCRNYLYNELTTNIFPAWYGTEWHFQGIAKTPQKGEYPFVEQSKVDTNRIACGYFITRILKGLGFKIKVYKLAQQPTSLIVKNLAQKENIIYFLNNESIPKIKSKIKEKGIYIVGLDCHVGFLVFDGKKYFRFVHSSYYDPPYCVTSDKLASFNPFAHSNDRVIGKLFDDEMLIKWLKGEKIKIKYPYKPK